MIDPRMIRARSALIMEQPFFGTLAMRLEAIESTQYDTMATDGRRLFYNPQYLDTLSEPRIKGMIAHEVEHCALKHHARRGDRDPKRWNIACDYAINSILKRAGFELWEGAYLDPQYDGLNAEAIYRILEQAEKQQQQSQQKEPEDQEQAAGGKDGDDDAPSDASNDVGDAQDEGDGEPQDAQQDGEGDGSDEPAAGDQPSDNADGDGADSGGGDSQQDGGSDDPQEGDGGDAQGSAPSSGGDPGQCGEILDAAPDHDEGAMAEAEAEWDVAVRQAVNIAKKQNAGTIPGFLEEVVADLADPRTDWRAELRRFATPSSTKDYSWTKPNRRLMSQGFFNPGLISDGINHVAIIIDSSGSIDYDALRKFGGEGQAILDEGGVDEVTVLFVDTRVNRIDRYSKGDRIDFTVQGRGGTAFSPAFAWLNENAPDITAAIYLTDLECDDFGPEPLYPVLWAAYGDPREIKQYAARLPFGECIDVQA